MYAAINIITIEKVIKEFGNSNFSNFKTKLSESLVDVLVPIGKEMDKLLKDYKYLDSVIKKGAMDAKKIAKPIISEVYEKLGLLKT